MLGCWKNCYSFTCNLLLAELTAFPIAMVETLTESNLQRIHRGLQRERAQPITAAPAVGIRGSLLPSRHTREQREKALVFSTFVLPPFYSVWGSGLWGGATIFREFLCFSVLPGMAPAAIYPEVHLTNNLDVS